VKSSIDHSQKLLLTGYKKRADFPNNDDASTERWILRSIYPDPLPPTHRRRLVVRDSAFEEKEEIPMKKSKLRTRSGVSTNVFWVEY
jgi:hypothetical protein